MPVLREQTFIVEREWKVNTEKDASDFGPAEHSTRRKLRQQIRDSVEQLGSEVKDVTVRELNHDHEDAGGLYVNLSYTFEVAVHGFWDSTSNPRPEQHNVQREVNKGDFHGEFKIRPLT